MSIIKYKTHKIIIFAICIIVSMIFMLELNRMNKSETIMKNNTRRLQGTEPIPPEPQPLVQCTGVHALCIFAACAPDGTCRCKTYDSIYQIATAAIKNDTMKDATLSYCTLESPCETNQAPICEAIINNEYYVNDQLSKVTSAYSWNLFCERAWPTEVWSECTDGLWASCMMAPCSYDPQSDFTLCQCDVKIGVNVPWIDNDARQSCRYPTRIIKATVPVGFDFGSFIGTDYVFQACESALQRNRYPKRNQYPVTGDTYQGPYAPQGRGRYDGRNYRS